MASRQINNESARPPTMLDLPDLDIPDGDPEAADLRSKRTGPTTLKPRATLTQQHDSVSQRNRRYAESERKRSPGEPIVLPPAPQVVAQAIPDASMAFVLIVASQFQQLLNPAGIPLWIALVLAPNLVTLMLTDGRKNPWWRRAAMVNFITIGALLPVSVIGRYLVRTPYLDEAHGAVLPTVLGLGAALAVLITLGISSAVLSREDPEYAGVLILPACLLVPVSFGDGRISSLELTLMVVGIVYIASAIATVVASLLTGALPALVAPSIFAGEFVLLSLLQKLPSVPSGAATSITVTFLSLILAAGLLTVIVPILSIWCTRVRQEVRELDARTIRG
jgi:hypothetical protein